jgi:glycolate oxidase
MPALLDFAGIVGERNVITAASELRTYECDGLAGFRVRPAVVVLPETTAQVAAAVKLARALGMPIVPPGPDCRVARSPSRVAR